MQNIFELNNVIAVLLAYFIGSIPSAIWVSKWFFGVDVRDYGSNNAGATNTFRVIGKFAGFSVLFLDILKSIEEQNLVIDGVISDQSDAALKSVSIVAEKLGLIHKNLSFINNSLNKANQYKILYKNKIKVPNTYQCSLGQEKIFIEKSGYVHF